jgi:hypothetical protein
MTTLTNPFMITAPASVRGTRSSYSRPLAFASFTERERRYLVPMNLFSMRQKKQTTSAVRPASAVTETVVAHG